MKKAFTTVELVMMAMFTAILCASAYLSIPTPLPNAAHITLLNFMIILIALVFELRDSTIIIALWMIMGAIGVPVFIGGGAGLGYLFGVFGGYTFSFIIASIVVGLIKGQKYKRLKYTIVAIIGVVIIDIVGMIWWKFNGNLTWKVAFLSGSWHSFHSTSLRLSSPHSSFHCSRDFSLRRTTKRPMNRQKKPD